MLLYYNVNTVKVRPSALLDFGPIRCHGKDHDVDIAKPHSPAEARGIHPTDFIIFYYDLPSGYA